MLRSLIHYWRMNLAVVAGVAVTTAVLTGALLVGDSLRGSLRGLTLDRLGRIDQALLNHRFFPEDLANRMANQPGLKNSGHEHVPVLLLKGSAVHPGSERRASGVQILGVDERFATLYPDSEGDQDLDFSRSPKQVFPSAVLNEPLLEELGASVGDDLLLSFGRTPSVPTASLMGRREQRDILTTLRVTVTAVLPAKGPGRFGLEARQNRPLNAYVELSTVQKRLDRRAEVNLLLVASPVSATNTGDNSPTLVEALQNSTELRDLGLTLRRGSGYVAVESTELVLRPRTAAIVMELAARLEALAWPYLTYLANTMTIGDRLLPYSTVTAMEIPAPGSIGKLTTVSGSALDSLGPTQIALNTWAAKELDAEPGDTLELTYYLVGANDELTTAAASFEVGATVEMESLGADPTLTPAVPGISDATDIAGWDPPFPVDLGLVRSQDEDYWDQYRGAPKAIVGLQAGQDLWRSRYGQLTGIRLVPISGSDPDGLQRHLEQELPRSLSLESAGFKWLPLRAQGLRGASGTTDFAGLFIGFSLFLIVSAALLVGLLFMLLVEQRGREAGLLLATGYTVKRVRRRFMIEGGLLALLGATVGTGLAVLYTRAVLQGLAAWWAPVLDTPFLEVHVTASTLLLGALAAILLVLVVIGRTVRRISRAPVRQLLAGSVATLSKRKSSRRATRTAQIGSALALVLFGVSLVAGMESAPALFFGVGAALVLSGIAAFAAWSQRSGSPSEMGTTFVVPRLAARNSSRNLGRSLLSVSLVASASFVLVSVSASRKTHDSDSLSRSSGTGGFALIAEADTPLPAPLGEVEPDLDSDASYHSFRLLPGDDASCLNLYQPEKPRLLGVPSSFVDRGGFGFRSTLQPAENPWDLLSEPLEDGAIPTIGDYNSVRWILHSGLGRDLLMEADNGEQIRLRIVGLLETSIFQSELLISEELFLRHFPDHDGFAYFLGDQQPEQLSSTVAALEGGLSAYGFDVESAAKRLANFQAVENMYLTTFEVLGGLGMLLGTVGLGVVLLRNTLERRGELAALRAFGFRRATLAWMVVAENAFLLVVGLVVGSVAGLIAVAPYLVTGGIQVPWWSLLGILMAVFAVGLLASIAAVLGSLRVPLLPALKAE